MFEQILSLYCLNHLLVIFLKTIYYFLKTKSIFFNTINLFTLKKQFQKIFFIIFYIIFEKKKLQHIKNIMTNCIKFNKLF